jgi:hypothetical protein
MKAMFSENPGTHYMKTHGADHCAHCVEWHEQQWIELFRLPAGEQLAYLPSYDRAVKYHLASDCWGLENGFTEM